MRAIPIDPMPFTPLVHIGTDADTLRGRLGALGETLFVFDDSTHASIAAASAHLASSGPVLVTTSAADAAAVVRGVSDDEDHIAWLLRRWEDSGEGQTSLGVWEGGTGPP